MLLRTATGKLAGGELLFGPPPRLTLARRWESAVLVNADIETIINKSEHVKNTKKEKGDDLTPKQKKEPRPRRGDIPRGQLYYSQIIRQGSQVQIS